MDSFTTIPALAVSSSSPSNPPFSLASEAEDPNIDFADYERSGAGATTFCIIA